MKNLEIDERFGKIIVRKMQFRISEETTFFQLYLVYFLPVFL